MNRLPRFVSTFLAFALVLAAPGLAPYQAAAQTMAARVSIPSVPGSAAGAVIGLGGSAVLLPAASLQTGLVPSLSPSAALAPALLAPAAAVNSAVAAIPLAAPSTLQALAPSAAAKLDANAPAPVAALAALKTGGSTLSAAAKGESADAPRVALNGLFEGEAARPETLAVSALSAPSDAPRLDASAPQAAAKGPRWVKTFGPEGRPATSIKRTLSVGFLAAVVPIVLTMGTVVVAQLLGYHMHPNYQGPSAGLAPSVLSALALWAGAAIMAPVSEEAIFRGGLQGRLRALSVKLHLGDYVLPALITSVVFVALHETSDPVLFGTRMVHAMILSYVYQKEGILASMAAHGFFNGLLALSIVLTALHAPLLGIAVVPLAIYFAIKSIKLIRSQKSDKASGTLIPKPLSGWLSVALAALLIAGYFTIMPNIFWPIGAVALMINAARRLKRKA